MSAKPKTFHQDGVTEVRMTVLKHHRRSLEELEKANPQQPKETDEAYEKRIDALAEKTAKRVDFHVFDADSMIGGSVLDLFKKAEDGHKYDCVIENNELKELKTEEEKKS